MEIKRTTDIVIETKRRFVVYQGESPETVICAECTQQMLSAEAFALLVGISRRRVYRLVETGTAHFLETEIGVLLVCPNCSNPLVNQRQ